MGVAQGATAGDYFYPRSPCGERPCRRLHSNESSVFLSTLSLRRATLGAGKSCDVCGISIHALLAESDGHMQPIGRAPRISIHALLAESDIAGRITSNGTKISIHALLAESDIHAPNRHPCPRSISIHALLAESDSKSAQNSGALLRI